MKIPKKVINFLEKEGIKYEVILHKTVYTSYDKASTLKIKPVLIAKSILMKADTYLFIAVITANKIISKDKIKKIVDKKRGKESKKISFVTEKTMIKEFKGLKVGSIPPFGKIFKLPVFVDKLVLKNKKIYFPAGNYENSILLSPSNFKKTGESFFEGSFSLVKK